MHGCFFRHHRPFWGVPLVRIITFHKVTLREILVWEPRIRAWSFLVQVKGFELRVLFVRLAL